MSVKSMPRYIIVGLLLVFLLIPLSQVFAEVFDPLEKLNTSIIQFNGQTLSLTNDIEIRQFKNSPFVKIQGEATTGETVLIFLKDNNPDFQKVIIFDGQFHKGNLVEKYTSFGMGGILKNKEEILKEPVTQTILSGSKVNVLVSQYDRVTKGTSYVFQVKTFDVKKYSGTDWNKFEGKLDGVNISAQIIAPDGQVKEKFSGLTKYGIFEGSISVKDRLWPQGTYTLIVNSEFQGDNTSKSLKFFVVEDGSGGDSCVPVLPATTC